MAMTYVFIGMASYCLACLVVPPAPGRVAWSIRAAMFLFAALVAFVVESRG